MVFTAKASTLVQLVFWCEHCSEIPWGVNALNNGFLFSFMCSTTVTSSPRFRCEIEDIMGFTLYTSILDNINDVRQVSSISLISILVSREAFLCFTDIHKFPSMLYSAWTSLNYVFSSKAPSHLYKTKGLFSLSSFPSSCFPQHSCSR